MVVALRNKARSLRNSIQNYGSKGDVIPVRIDKRHVEWCKIKMWFSIQKKAKHSIFIGLRRNENWRRWKRKHEMPFSECICHNLISLVSNGESKWLGHRRRRADEDYWVTLCRDGFHTSFLHMGNRRRQNIYLPIYHAVAATYVNSEYSSWMLNLIDMFSMEQDNAKQRTHTLAPNASRTASSAPTILILYAASIHTWH